MQNECGVFDRPRTSKYLFTEVSKAMSLVFVEHIAVFKNYILNCHYETKHTEKYKNLTDAA